MNVNSDLRQQQISVLRVAVVLMLMWSSSGLAAEQGTNAEHAAPMVELDDRPVNEEGVDRPPGDENRPQDLRQGSSPSWAPLIWTQVLWLIVVGVVLPAFSIWRKRSDESELRGLNLPRGSIRGILALLIVGSFVNVLVFGSPLGNHLNVVITAFGTLAGSVTGFYFGERTATPK